MKNEKWGSHVDYMMTLLGYSIGVGCMWRFPYLCVRNGGGAFLIPLMVFLIIGTVPCVFLETVIGQFSQSGPINAWNLCPPFKGMAMGSVLISVFYSTYYSALFAWFLYYFYYSFSPIIPWTRCDNPWNTPSCISHNNVDDANVTHDSVAMTNAAKIIHNTSFFTNGTMHVTAMTSAEEFWK
ncbi:sodium- and chloride-dependent glycine transporter 1-like [Haliotis rufescens]|uniref:sodium- and chloride-dependent glycine transporter 1-like n=1 Tax=Haliotis rufescens TaxID=6454 RepID=UPI00201F337A|nr:sodium- and chloride-dependent glycine transporter 1-like [Haliotis rufescens]